MKNKFTMKNKSYVLAISFSNYTIDKSGMPKVMLAHQLEFNQSDISYVSLFTVKKNMFHDKLMLFCYFGLLIDGQFMGIFSIRNLIVILKEWQKQGYHMMSIHIHHLLYVRLNHIKKLLECVKEVPIKLFLHDYYFACTKYNLMKNNQYYCGGNGLNQQNCSDCQYYKDSVKQQKKIHALFQSHKERITFISPSEVTKNIFLKFHPKYTSQVIVIPHQEMEGINKKNLETVTSDKKIKLAFLGMPARHKGWDMWCQLVEELPKDKYEFFVFNSSKDNYPGTNKVHVQFTSEKLNAMTEALMDHHIQGVFLWSICQETYSYTCFESYSANAFIFTNIGSGNIADTVKKYQNGLIIDGNPLDFFKNDLHVKAIINNYRTTTEGGPVRLVDNKQIVHLTKEEFRNDIEIEASQCLKSLGLIEKILEKVYLKRINKN